MDDPSNHPQFLSQEILYEFLHRLYLWNSSHRHLLSYGPQLMLIILSLLAIAYGILEWISRSIGNHDMFNEDEE